MLTQTERPQSISGERSISAKHEAYLPTTLQQHHLMSDSRHAHLPIDHILAEIASLPLVSECAFESGLTALDPAMGAKPPLPTRNCATASFWRAAEAEILCAFPSFSVDEVVSLRDYLWFNGFETNQPVAMHRYLRSVAHSLLECTGPIARPRVPDSAIKPEGPSNGLSAWTRARRLWRWVTFAMPPDLLLAALGPHQQMPDRVELLTPTVSRILSDGGFAETHLHVGAAVDFPLLWASLQRAIADPQTKATASASPGACLKEGRLIGPWLIRAAITRYLLGAFLQSQSTYPFVRYLDDVALPLVSKVLGITRASALVGGLEELKSGQLKKGPDQHAVLQSIFATLTQVRVGRDPDTVDEAMLVDPLAKLFRPRGPRITAEMEFVAAALRYLESGAGLKDSLFATLFWQAIRVRGIFYRHVVQRPMTPGLQWFIRHYSRISPGRRPLHIGVQFERAGQIGGVEDGLRSLEVRTSPDEDREKTLGGLLKIDFPRNPRFQTSSIPSPQTRPAIEYGVVLHFTKERSEDARKGRPQAHWKGSHADPTASMTGYRYSRYYNTKANEARAFAQVLRNFPVSLEILRGMDVCTDELGVPTWVFVPLYQHVKTAGEHAATKLRQCLGLDVPPLQATAHVGEDFVHLLGGLRRVDEAIRHLGLREGDRLGHAVALGVDAMAWAQQAGRIALPRQERLLDLLWEWSWYARHGAPHDGGRAALLQREISRLWDALAKEPPGSPYELEQLVEDLHNPWSLKEAGFPNGPMPSPSKDRVGRVLDYLTDTQIFANGHHLEWIDPAEEGEALARLQAGLRRKVSTLGLTVEVNPSSNLLIGNLADLTNHPLWRLQSTRSNPDAPPVAVCVGSDDPLTFATTLREEFQLLHDAMTLGGLSEEEACCRVDRLRRRGMEARFTVPRSNHGLLALRCVIPPEPLIP